MIKAKSKTSKKITLGTKEWADSNVNCYFGCSNDCRYCYAKLMAIRFNRKTTQNWKNMIPNQKNISKGYAKRKGRIMFPTSHDITKESLNNCLIVLKKLLKARNEILITSKPNLYCTKKICADLKKYKEQIQFRFTITSINNEYIEFWEPRAPPFEERFKSLKYAFNLNYKTSISIEPFLDEDPYILVDILIPFVTESIWIGKMNYIRIKNGSSREKKYYSEIKKIYSKKNLQQIVNHMKSYKNNILRIKDSIYNYLKS